LFKRADCTYAKNNSRLPQLLPTALSNRTHEEEEEVRQNPQLVYYPLLLTLNINSWKIYPLLIEAKGGDSCERRNEERRLRVKAKRYEHSVIGLP